MPTHRSEQLRQARTPGTPNAPTPLPIQPSSTDCPQEVRALLALHGVGISPTPTDLAEALAPLPHAFRLTMLPLIPRDATDQIKRALVVILSTPNFKDIDLDNVLVPGVPTCFAGMLAVKFPTVSAISTTTTTTNQAAATLNSFRGTLATLTLAGTNLLPILDETPYAPFARVDGSENPLERERKLWLSRTPTPIIAILRGSVPTPTSIPGKSATHIHLLLLLTPIAANALSGMMGQRISLPRTQALLLGEEQL